MGFKEDREERGWVGRRRRIGGRDKNREEVGLEYLKERKRAERKRNKEEKEPSCKGVNERRGPSRGCRKSV